MFGDSFLLARVQQNGLLQAGSSAPAEYYRSGKRYTHGTDSGAISFIDFGQRPLYLAQWEIPQKDSHPVFVYVLIKQLDDTIIVYLPPGPEKGGFKAALQAAQVSFTSNTDAFEFTDKEQLLAAARLFATRLEDGTTDRYRGASTSEEKSRLLAQVAAKAQSAPPAAPSASASPAPGAQDAGAAAPNGCDQQAASPRDPGRMAPGVAMNAIVPALAVQQCQQAVAQFPNTARFVLQLGRAQEASRDASAAMANYQHAASMGYPVALFNLGVAYQEGLGTAPDYAAAGDYYRKAIAAGVDAQAELKEVVFDPAGYSNPSFFMALFQGQVTGSDAKAASVYLGEFMQMFHNTDDCRDVISTAAMGRLLMSEQFGTIGQLLTGLMQAHREPTNGDYGQDFKQGMDAAMGTNNNLLMSVSNARSDAQLFYNREGCHSPVARQFFHNVEVVAGG